MGWASKPNMGDGALKSVGVRRAGHGKLSVLGSMDVMECAGISGRLGGTWRVLGVSEQRWWIRVAWYKLESG